MALTTFTNMPQQGFLDIRLPLLPGKLPQPERDKLRISESKHVKSPKRRYFILDLDATILVKTR